MYFHPASLQALVPGEPTPEALHREEYLHAKDAIRQEADVRTEVDHRASSRADLLRAQVTARVGRFFA